MLKPAVKHYRYCRALAPEMDISLITIRLIIPRSIDLQC